MNANLRRSPRHRIARWASDLLQDLSYCFRRMRRQSGFTAFVVLIAGLGIGASATVYSVVNTLLLRPLPYRDPARLVWIQNGPSYSLQSDHFLDLKARTKSFSDMAGWFNFYSVGNSKLTGADEPERLTSVAVTQNFFSLLGIPLAPGRSFSDAECHAPFYRPPVAVLSNAFWKRKFAFDPSILGRKLVINDAPVTVVGVLPASFDFGSVLAPGNTIDIFLPLPLTDEFNRRGNTMAVIGRLNPGVTVSSAQAEFTILGRQLEAQYPRRNGIDPVLAPLEKHVSGRVLPALLVLACAVGVVMLIVCANLSSLQMARMTSRRREMAVRTALGAARHRLLRQALTESVALSFCGALLGLVLAFAGTRALAHLTAFRLPLLASVRLDGAALAFTLLATFLTGILFGLLPAIQTPALAAQDELKDNSRGAAGSRSHTWLRNALVISEVAFACVLLVGAGLLIRSFLRVLDTDLGFRPDRAYSIRVDPSAQYKTKEQRGGYFDGVLQRVKAIPGIAEAGLTDVLPFDGDRSWGVSGKGQVYPKGHMPEAFIRIVSEGYTEAAGIPLKAGHTFTARDNAVGANVVMINESLARTLWPGQNAVGQLMNQDGGRQVVGVVGDVRHFAAEETGGNEMYIPIRQTRDYDEVELVVRTALPEATAANAVRAALRPLDPNMPLRDFRAMSSAQLVLAAQTNGKKSRGPKTPEGKRKSAANSRKHGLYAKTFHPDPLFDADFDRFLATFQSEYSPATRRQHDLVRVAAVSLARAGWAHRLAVQILKQRTKKGRSPRPPRHSLPLFRRSESPHNRHRQSVYSRKPLLQTLAKRYRPPHEIAGTNQIRSRRPH